LLKGATPRRRIRQHEYDTIYTLENRDGQEIRDIRGSLVPKTSVVNKMQRGQGMPIGTFVKTILIMFTENTTGTNTIPT
jgi:hypothetical protein